MKRETQAGYQPEFHTLNSHRSMKTKPVLILLSLCTIASTAFASVEQTVTDLLPKLAAEKVEERYAPQMELQALALNASRPGAEAERAALAEVLAAKAADTSVAQPARVWLLRQLEYIGAAESVPALTGLLKDPDAEVRECTRRALEKNSASAATESLRAALEQGGDTRWTIGLIQSLGERRDANSVNLIAPHLGSADTAFAAACALAKIATEPAVKELWAAFDQKVAAAPDALVDAANRLVATGEAKRATAIYAKLCAGGVAAQCRAAALIGLAKANPAQAKSLLLENLSAPDLKLEEAGVIAARQVYGKKASVELAGLLPGLGISAKVAVLRALDASAEKEVIALAGSPDHTVQAAAFEALGRIGSAACLPMLMPAATGSPSDVQKAAAAALARLHGPGADAAIAKLAAQGKPDVRATAITALAARDDQAALAALLKYAGESDRSVSSAACEALARIGTDTEIEPLARLALAGNTSGTAAALQEVAGRAQDKAAAADKLVSLTATASSDKLPILFEALARVGGDEALTAISKSASRSKDEVKDAAIRALADWSDFAATKPLLIIAADPDTTRVHNVLAIQGVARLVKSSDKETAQARLDAAEAAMKAATRVEEKRLLLSAIASIRDPKAAEAVKPYLTEPDLKSEAGLAAVSLAEALVKKNKPTARSLARAVKDASLSEDITRRADAILKK
jgi:HEAT repeat protein